MTFNVLSDISLETPAGAMALKEGQVIRLADTEALPLIEAGLITPVGRVAYRIYSALLEAFLWVVQDDAGAACLRAEGISEPIYTGHEIAELRGMGREGLKTIQNIKQIFEKSKIEDIS